MATILLTWELGGNAGHVHPLGALASELIRRGHRAIVAVKDLSAGEKYLAPLGIEFIQAPVWLGRVNPKTPPAINFAELLMRVGYLDIDQIAGQIRSWITLLKSIKTDLILADHSPSVLLAAQVLEIKAAPLGTSFFAPPDHPLMASIQPWAKFPKERFESSEATILGNINQALLQCGGKSLDHLAKVFVASHNYLLTFPETDHYLTRTDTPYWGLIQSSKNAPEPIWPKHPGPKVYVYMKHGSKPYKTLVNGLKQLGWPSLIVSRGITEEQAKTFSAENITFCPDLVNLASVAQQADVAISNCNHGTAVELLQRGCKQLVIPEQIEQAMLSHRLSKQGLAISAGSELDSYRESIESVHNSQTLASKVKQFNQTYGKIKPDKQLFALVSDIEKRLLGKL